MTMEEIYRPVEVFVVRAANLFARETDYRSAWPHPQTGRMQHVNSIFCIQRSLFFDVTEARRKIFADSSKITFELHLLLLC